ncbi:MAG TPA: Fe-S-binding domain-containing protein, partial [Gemmatimonadetes bacterium]|nr:Fe-S-binding domain-containing protein [Gemmatimonadota bacterium]
LQGGLLVMISHGISTGALFLLIGMLYERRHTRLIADFGGIGRVAPWLTTAFVITALASIG